MTKVSLSTKLPVSARMVWNVIGGFNNLARWHPAVAKSEETKEGVTTVRRLTLHGGGKCLAFRILDIIRRYAVHALGRDSIACGIDDSDRHQRVVFPRIGNCAIDNRACVGERDGRRRQAGCGCRNWRRCCRLRRRGGNGERGDQ